MRVQAVRWLAGAAVAALAGSASATVLWDTGAPNPVMFNGNLTYLGFSSGNLGAGSEQRWAAQPFRIDAAGTVIQQIDIDYFIPAGGEFDNVNFIIWNRTGLAAPVNGNQFLSGVLGPMDPGLDDPRIAAIDNYLHTYTVNIPIPAGDYYLTVYGDGGTAPNNAAWLTGAVGQDESLEQAFMWRSAQFPSPGFQAYTSAAIAPAAGQDPGDVWNTSFTLHGIPEPSSLALLAIGAGLLARRRA
ncbi:MAG: PEP-CTERM sorting domain-containing protein [Planctomycetes bacterium]|nr:PEP-CTERM sorting domain-containing protein [Planctomycetota bacterium]